MADTDSVLDELYGVIESRKGGDPEKSYTAKKFAKGADHIAKKIGEEATEVAIAAARRERGEVRGAQVAGAITAQVGAAQVVGDDEDDVRRAQDRRLSPCAGNA